MGRGPIATKQEWTPKRTAMELSAVLIRLAESARDVTLPYDNAHIVVLGEQPTEVLGRVTFNKAADAVRK